MTDVVKMCDVIDNCTECPRYGDDCDGDKRLYTHEEAWGMSDLISRADAMAYPLSWEHYDKEHGCREFICGVESYREYIEYLPSARPTGEWIPFTRRPMTEEEQKDYPNCTFMFDCVLPDDGEEILVSSGRFVWMDTFCNDIDGCYLDRGDDIDEDMAWMPLPEPYKGGEDE